MLFWRVVVFFNSVTILMLKILGRGALPSLPVRLFGPGSALWQRGPSKTSWSGLMQGSKWRNTFTEDSISDGKRSMLYKGL